LNPARDPGAKGLRLAIFFLIAGLGVLGACAGVQIKTRRGVTHEVRQGETLWRICHTYGANMQTVSRLNGIADPERIQAGQKIFIPGADRVRRVESAAESSKIVAEGGIARGRRGPDAMGKTPAAGDRGRQREKATAGQAPKRSSSLRFIWPVKGPVTSWFGVRDGRRHDGIDIAVPMGTPILAAESGIVVYSGSQIKGYGNVVILKHREGFSTVYGHHSANRVKVDEQVRKGQVVGYAGKTGLASGVHLHFEVRYGVRAVDPMDYLP